MSIYALILRLSSGNKYDSQQCCAYASSLHDDVIKWKHFPRYWPFVRGIHRSPVNSPHKGQWRGAFMFSLIYVWINRWVNNREAGDLRCYRAHYDVIVMTKHGRRFDSFILSIPLNTEYIIIHIYVYIYIYTWLIWSLKYKYHKMFRYLVVGAIIIHQYDTNIYTISDRYLNGTIETFTDNVYT